MENRKIKRNLEGLLRFAVQHTKCEDSTQPSQFEELSEERRAFLENALKSLTTDVVEELQSAMDTLNSGDEDKTEEKLRAFNVLRDRIDHIDFANNLVQIGGSHIIMEYLKSKDTKLRVAAMYTIAEMSQNNPFCQKHFVDNHILPMLLENLKESEEVSSCAIHTISSLIRNYEEGLSEFLKNGGIKEITTCLNSECQRVFVKACFLIACLSSEKIIIKDKFVESSSITILQNRLDPIFEYDNKTEIILYALSELTSSDTWTPTAATLNTTRLYIEEFILKCGNDEQCEEMLGYANQILTNILKHT